MCICGRRYDDKNDVQVNLSSKTVSKPKKSGGASYAKAPSPAPMVYTSLQLTCPIDSQAPESSSH